MNQPESLNHLIEYLKSLPIEARTQIIATLLAPLTPWGTYHQYSAIWEEAGFHVLPNMYYAPMPDARKLPDELWTRGYSLAGIDMNDAQQLEFLTRIIPQYAGELASLPDEPTGSDTEFHWNNPMYTYFDAVMLHTMIRHFKPRRVIEVGSGFSTLMSVRAAALNGQTRVTAIEPFPRDFLNRLPHLEELIVKPVQEVDLSVFSSLQANDILFIDTSHAIKTGGDVTTIYLEILPRLPQGVLVHIHDIFLPGEYPRAWVVNNRCGWNEQYLVAALLMFSSQFEVLFGTAYVQHKFPEQVVKLREQIAYANYGGSLWLRVRQ